MGNKCDMEDERVVAAQRGRQLSDQLGESVGAGFCFSGDSFDFSAAGMSVTLTVLL